MWAADVILVPICLKGSFFSKNIYVNAFLHKTSPIWVLAEKFFHMVIKETL